MRGEAASAEDRATVARQLGRDPLPFAVVARCAGGAPIAVAQEARTPDGRPFPTSYWLTCPALVRAVGRLEAEGGVRRLEHRLEQEPELAADFDAARGRQIALRADGAALGVGGTRAPRAVKCLHAHAAFALGSPPYRLGLEILLAAGGPPVPCCLEDPA